MRYLIHDIPGFLFIYFILFGFIILGLDLERHKRGGVKDTTPEVVLLQVWSN